MNDSLITQWIYRQLSQVLQRGVGFGVLKYLRHDPELEPLRTAPEPEINFNYLGQFDQFDADAQMPFQMAPEVIRNEQHPQEGKGALLHVVASVSGREMHLRWLYSKNVFKKRRLVPWHMLLQENCRRLSG